MRTGRHAEILPRRKRRISSAFGSKAAQYEKKAVIQTALLHRLVPRIASRSTPTESWIDLGCGGGVLMRLLREAGVKTPCMTGLDLAYESLLLVKNREHLPVIRGDLDALPFSPRSFDGMVLASVLQWLHPPLRALRGCGDLLRNGGHCVFSIFVNESFHEILSVRRAFGLAVSVQCPSGKELLHFFQAPPFDLLEYELVRETTLFPDAMSLLKHLSATGAAATDGPKLARRDLSALCETYEKKFRKTGGVPLTWVALIGTARKRTES
jgi:SAM-dependent methyltransferase